MRIVMMPVKVKRPVEATPERALALLQAGVSIPEMAKMWGVSRPLIYALLHRAGWEPHPLALAPKS